MIRNLAKFPQAPIVLISGIAAGCGIPSIVDARVGRDGSIFLKVYENEDFTVERQQLLDIADLCGVVPEDVDVERDVERLGEATIVVKQSLFDFALQYGEEPAFDAKIDLPGFEDSEEGIEASVALSLSRRE